MATKTKGRSARSRKQPAKQVQGPVRSVQNMALEELLDTVKYHMVLRVGEFAEGLEVLDTLVGNHELESCGGSDLAVWIQNEGTIKDRAQLFLAVLPIAERAYKHREVERGGRRKYGEQAQE